MLATVRSGKVWTLAALSVLCLTQTGCPRDMVIGAVAGAVGTAIVYEANDNGHDHGRYERRPRRDGYEYESRSRELYRTCDPTRRKITRCDGQVSGGPGWSSSSERCVTTWQSECDRLRQYNSYGSSNSVAASHAEIGRRFGMTESSVDMLMTALGKAEKGDSKALEALGLVDSDYSALAAGQMPESTSIQRIASSLQASEESVVEVFQTILKAKAKKERERQEEADRQAYLGNA